MKAYLLAAGYATRMHPLTRDRPKPLLEVAGAPILTHIVREVVALEGLSQVVVVTNARFADLFRSWAAGLRPSLAVPLSVVDDGSTSDDDKLGAVGDLAFALERVPVGGEDWLVAAGDNLLGFALAPLQRVFARHGAPLLVVRRVADHGPSRYNEVTLDADGRVIDFREKPQDPRTDLAAIALYFFPASASGWLERYLADGGERDAPGHFVAWLVRHTEVRAVPIPGPWFDIGSLDGLAWAREHFRPPARGAR